MLKEAEGISLTERQRYWLEQIQSCEALGKTIAEYAMDQGIEAKAMYAGKKALVMKGVLPHTHATRFQRARVVGADIVNEWRIQLPNGVSVAFSGSTDAATLTTVLNTNSCSENGSSFRVSSTSTASPLIALRKSTMSRHR